MRVSRTIWLPILTAIVGCCLGAFVTTRYWLHDWARTDDLRNRVSARLHVRSLRQARSGNSEQLINELEALLDGEIIGLGRTTNASNPNHKESVEALKIVAKYRKEFPHSSGNQEITQAVNQVLLTTAP